MTAPNSPLINKDESLDKILDGRYENIDGKVAIPATNHKAKQQIIDLINREVVAARIDENKLYTKFLSDYYTGKHEVDLDSFLYNRIAELNQRKPTPSNKDRSTDESI